jgi:hypothetical protein
MSGPPLEVIRYMEQLRWNGCGQVFTAGAPAKGGEENDEARCRPHGISSFGGTSTSLILRLRVLRRLMRSR